MSAIGTNLPVDAALHEAGHETTSPLLLHGRYRGNACARIEG
jgi:hypothetical protein